MSSPHGSDSSPPPKPGLVAVPVDGETVVYDPDSDVLHRLDPPATAVWSRLDGQATVHAVASRIAAAFGAPEEAVRADVADLTGTLWDKGLLEGSPLPHASHPAQDDAPVRQPPPELPLPEAVYRAGRYRALEHTFEVATSDAAVRDYLAEVLTDLAAPDDAGSAVSRYELVHPSPDVRRQTWVAQHDGEVVLATDWLDRALYALLWRINADTVRRSVPRYPMVHAAAATFGGVAVLLPAPSDAGKTTTVAGLVRAGFGYLTDEAVAIDPDTLLALPYPKALSVNRGSWEALADIRPPHGDRIEGQWQLPASFIRQRAITGPAPVRFVVLPSYDRGAATRLEPAPRAEMLMRLADSAFHFQDAPRRNLDVLARMLDGADCYRLVLGDLDKAVRLVGELVAT